MVIIIIRIKCDSNSPFRTHLNVLVLAMVIFLSGCLSSGTADADESEPTVINNYYNETTNELPVIYFLGFDSGTSLDNHYSSNSTFNSSTGIEEYRMYYLTLGLVFTVIDIDGNITDVGIDLDLDQELDHVLVNNDSWSNYSTHFTPGIALSNGSSVSLAGDWYERCYVTFNLIALDDDGGKSLIPLTRGVDGGFDQSDRGCKENYTHIDYVPGDY